MRRRGQRVSCRGVRGACDRGRSEVYAHVNGGDRAGRDGDRRAFCHSRASCHRDHPGACHLGRTLFGPAGRSHGRLCVCRRGLCCLACRSSTLGLRSSLACAWGCGVASAILSVCGWAGGRMRVLRRWALGRRRGVVREMACLWLYISSTEMPFLEYWSEKWGEVKFGQCSCSGGKVAENDVNHRSRLKQRAWTSSPNAHQPAGLLSPSLYSKSLAMIPR